MVTGLPLLPLFVLTIEVQFCIAFVLTIIFYRR